MLGSCEVCARSVLGLCKDCARHVLEPVPLHSAGDTCVLGFWVSEVGVPSLSDKLVVGIWHRHCEVLIIDFCRIWASTPTCTFPLAMASGFGKPRRTTLPLFCSPGLMLHRGLS